MRNRGLEHPNLVQNIVTLRNHTTIGQNPPADGQSPREWLRAACPRLGSSCPTTWSDQDFARETVPTYELAEARLAACARCPETGGACADDVSMWAPGQVPTWVNTSLEGKPCDRWREYLVRRRLTDSNVPRSLHGKTFRSFEQRNADAVAAVEAVARLHDEIRREQSGWLVLTGGQGAGKTHLAVALLRNLITKIPRALVWYADGATVRGLLQERWADRGKGSPDPLENAARSNVLVFEDLDPRGHALIREPIEALLRRRWLAAMPTLVTSRDSTRVLAKAYAAVPGLTEAPTCQL